MDSNGTTNGAGDNHLRAYQHHSGAHVASWLVTSGRCQAPCPSPPDRIPPNTYSKRGGCTRTLFQLLTLEPNQTLLAIGSHICCLITIGSDFDLCMHRITELITKLSITYSTMQYMQSDLNWEQCNVLVSFIFIYFKEVLIWWDNFKKLLLHYVCFPTDTGSFT